MLFFLPTLYLAGAAAASFLLSGCNTKEEDHAESNPDASATTRPDQQSDVDKFHPYTDNFTGFYVLTREDEKQLNDCYMSFGDCNDAMKDAGVSPGYGKWQCSDDLTKCAMGKPVFKNLNEIVQRARDLEKSTTKTTDTKELILEANEAKFKEFVQDLPDGIFLTQTTADKKLKTMPQDKLTRRYEYEFGTALRKAKKGDPDYHRHFCEMQRLGNEAHIKQDSISFHSDLINKAFDKARQQHHDANPSDRRVVFLTDCEAPKKSPK